MDPITLTVALWAFATGATLTSFAGVVVVRVPAGESLGGRSRCDGCGQQIPGWRNIPVVSGATMRTTACCGAQLPRWHWLTELAGGTLWAAAALTLPLAVGLPAAAAATAAVTVWKVRKAGRAAAADAA